MDRKQTIADESVRGFYRFLRSPYAVRAGNVLWRAMSDFRRARSSGAIPVELMEARVEQLESRLEVLRAKIDALTEMLTALEAKAAPAKKKRAPGKARKKAEKK